MRMHLSVDEQGWPIVCFHPADSALELVGEFLRSDVDIVLPSCDLLIERIGSILAGRQACWRWNGNSSRLEIERPASHLIDKYGPALGSERTAILATQGLLQIVRAWRDFVAGLPRQRELSR
jgi:hypothetical protein